MSLWMYDGAWSPLRGKEAEKERQLIGKLREFGTRGTQLVGEEDVDELWPKIVPLLVPDVDPLAVGICKRKDLAWVGPLGAFARDAQRPARRALVGARDDDDLDRVGFCEGCGEERAGGSEDPARGEDQVCGEE